MATEPQHPASSSDDDDASSAYSSCDESDLDRYCSADSVLGTGSLAGSLANRSDLIDAFRDLPADDLLLPPSSSPSATPTPHRPHQRRRRRRRRSGASEFAPTSLGVVRRFGGVGASDPPPPEEEGGGSDHEEDSMLEDYGSNDSDDEDDEISNDDGDLHNSAAVELYVRKVEMESRRRSPLLMDSSVAFGATDWDEFMRESEAGGFSGFSLDQDQPFQRPQTGSLDGAVEDMIRSYQSSAAEPSDRIRTTDPIKNTLNDSAVSATQNPPPEKDATFDSSRGDRRSCNEQITREVIDGPSEERVYDESAPPCTDSTGTSQEVEGESTVPPAIDDACKEASFREETIAILSTADGVEEIPVAAEVGAMKSCFFYLTLNFALMEYLLLRCLFILDSTLNLWTLVSRV